MVIWIIVLFVMFVINRTSLPPSLGGNLTLPHSRQERGNHVLLIPHFFLFFDIAK